MLVYEEIEDILFKSALEAYNRYIDWSGGDAAHDAGAESLITTSIANNIVATKDGGHVLCDARENYKQYALRRARPMEELSGRPLPSNESYLGVLHEYACPGCAYPGCP